MTGNEHRSGPDTTYLDAVAVLESGDARKCEQLAADPGTAPEMLYYLAGSDVPDVRAKVASNTTTPYQADWVLCEDPVDDVRAGLIGKTVSRLAELEPERADRIIEASRAILVRLAEDQSVAVRRLLAEEARASKHVPAEVIERLARDPDLAVACPVLQHSPLLDDAFLIELIGEHLLAPALVSISSRQNVGPDLSDRIVSTMDTDAVATLLKNGNAQIREDTLDLIATESRRVKAWQEPLTARPDLPTSAIRIISEFVSDKLLACLGERDDIDTETLVYLRERMQLRLVEITEAERDRERIVSEVERELVDLRSRGKLNAVYVENAMDDGRLMHVWIAIGLLSDTNSGFAYRVFTSRNPKAIVSLAWLAHLPAWIVMDLQTKVAGLEVRECVRPPSRHDFPLNEAEMRWQLTAMGYDADNPRKSA